MRAKPRGTTNRNDRGSAAARRKRKQLVLDRFGDGVTALCSFNCGTVLTFETLYIDRFPVPGCLGGKYTWGNIRPACGPCNSFHGWSLRSLEIGVAPVAAVG